MVVKINEFSSKLKKLKK